MWYKLSHHHVVKNGELIAELKIDVKTDTYCIVIAMNVSRISFQFRLNGQSSALNSPAKKPGRGVRPGRPTPLAGRIGRCGVRSIPNVV
jgi:hypothetical protein